MAPDLMAVSVDDEEFNLRLVESMAEGAGLNVKSFASPLRALEYIRGNPADIVFVDYMMPEMSGLELIKGIRAVHPDVPVIMITFVNDDRDLKLRALEYGATEFLNKPLDAAEFRARVASLSRLRRAQLLLKDRALLLEEEVRRATSRIADREHETLQTLGKAAEYRDPETSGHIVRVAHYARIIARVMGESAETQDLLFNSTPLHDIGKIGIPDHILQKEGSLTAEEWEIMKSHAVIGYEILKNARSTYLQHGAIVALTHHEMYNGKGYPGGLRGEEIHLFGRIVAVADVFDALTTKRPYKVAFPLEVSLELLNNEKGSRLDPGIVDLFIGNFSEVRDIFNAHREP